MAKKIPIVFYKKSKLIMWKNAKIILGKNFSGRIMIGNHGLCFSNGNDYTLINNNGFIYFEGGNVEIQAGNIWYNQGRITIGGSVLIGVRTKINCFASINIGDKTQVVHECQIMDTNFHYLRDTATSEIASILNPIVIGDRCWIGNRTSIMCGTVLPNSTIVGSNSLVNKDYSKNIEPNSLIAGCPAKYIRGNLERLSFVDLSMEKKLAVKEYEQYRVI